VRQSRDGPQWWRRHDMDVRGHSGRRLLR
jgi:hypothetical protein